MWGSISQQKDQSSTSSYTDDHDVELHTNPVLSLWPLHVFDVGGLQIKENIQSFQEYHDVLWDKEVCKCMMKIDYEIPRKN